MWITANDGHTPPIDAAAPPPIESAPEKRVSTVELFFDLVFVLAVTRVSALLEHDPSWSGALHALVVFVPVYWLWVGTAIQTNVRDLDDVGLRLEILVVALAAVFMALALPRAYEDLGLLYALAYWGGRSVLGWRLFRRPVGSSGLPINPFVVSIVLTAPLLVTGALVHGDARLLIWGIAAVLDLSTPTVLRSRLVNMRFAADHLAERFGLFVLIAIGESVVAVGASVGAETHVDAASLTAITAAFVLSGALWWVYFHFAANMIGHVLAHARVQLDIARLVLSYGHLLFIAAIVALAVGMRAAIAAPSEPLGWAFSVLLCGGTAVYLATFGMTRWIMRRRISTTRLGGAAFAVVVLFGGTTIPALISVTLLAVAVVALNVVEFRRAASTPGESRPWDPVPES